MVSPRTDFSGDETAFLYPDIRTAMVGSFSAAARKLGASPSAVSRSVAKLEQALALQLLHRTTRKLRLCESGEEAFAHYGHFRY